MKEVPEFIKYRAQCGLLGGVALITPFATNILQILTFDIKPYDLYTSTLVWSLDILLAYFGWKVIQWNHNYLAKKEFEYAQHPHE